MKRQKGFTLIELLVVIAIIGLLSTLAVIALNNARSKSRDARRVSDIKQIQSALELYYNDANGYPPTTGANPIEIGNKCLQLFTNGFVETTCNPTGTIYMTRVPSNPAPNGSAYKYRNTDTANAREYKIEYTLENGAGGVPAGVNTASQAGIYGASKIVD
ncbi:type II secretion system protein [Patescibacteria group bacterium]|nr:type II secretion system protein [Patescibacteria group bacterium]